MPTKEIYVGDCISFMKTMNPESVGLIISDLPYLIDYRSNRRTVREKFDHIKNDKKNFNSQKFVEDYIEQSFKILKNDSAIYLFCSWHNIDIFKQSFEQYFTLKNILVWNKNNHGTGDLKGSYAPKHEFILFGHKGRALNKGKRLPDVLDFAKINSALLTHPTEKPKDLLKVFIENNSSEGDIIFDGVAGTGSTGEAATELNRNFLGCELDTEHVPELINRNFKFISNELVND